MANRNAIPPNARLPSQEEGTPDPAVPRHLDATIPPLAPLPRVPVAAVVQNLFDRSPSSLPPRPSSISPVAFPSSYPPPPIPPARNALLPFFVGGALGAILATAVAVGLLWSPSHDLQQASQWLPAAPAAAYPPHTVHYLPTVHIVASDPPKTDTEPGPFDKEQARGLVASQAAAIHQCGLQGVDTSIFVTFEPSGEMSLIDVRGESPLSERASACVDDILIGLRTPAFQGGPQTVVVHIDGRTGLVLRP